MTGAPADQKRVRLDKWLWAARFFKTRSLASRACELGKIDCNGQQAKASREIRIGDLSASEERCWRLPVGGLAAQ